MITIKKGITNWILCMISCTLLVLSGTWSCWAADYVCGSDGVNNSCTPSGLKNLINGAAAGDTIYIASGTHSWATSVPVVISKAITISGRGTYMVDGWNDTGTWPVQLNVGSDSAFHIASRTGGNSLVRLTGIYFSGTVGEAYGCYVGNSGMIINERNNDYNNTGNLNPYRIDNCKFDSQAGIIATHSNKEGLIDHIYHSSPQIDSQTHIFMVQRCGVSGEGDNSFTDEVGFGGSNFTFIEDCTINITGTPNPVTPRVFIDSQAGGRFVIRHCNIRSCQGGVHGTESGAPLRGAYAQEIYANNFEWGRTDWNVHTPYYWRGGPLYFHNNTVRYADSMIRTWVQRSEKAFGRFGQCDGSHSWDGSGSPNGWRCLDQQGTGKANYANIAAPGFLQEAFPSYIGNNSMIGTNAAFSHNNPTYLKSGIDYVYCSDNSCAPVGYTPYPYPHPFQMEGGTRPQAPKSLKIIN
jgi:hypothetical protein